MKQSILVLVFLIFVIYNGKTQVGINTNQPHSSAALDVTSTTQGVLLPRLTAVQRDAIQDPVGGLILWCLDCGDSGELNVYNGNLWTNMIGNPAQPPSSFICGTSTITFNYNGVNVTYGTVLGAESRCWLDRNLGAVQVATSSNDHNSYGDLFQWGRLDDGHQERSSDDTTELSPTNIPGHDGFIISPNMPYDWRIGQNNNLWQGINGLNNPCPSGFRLPNESEWQNEINSWTPKSSVGAFNSPLKLPVAGFRYSINGSLNFAGTYGYYWSSDVNGIYARKLFFDNSNANTYNYNRADGLCVRCIKE